MKPGWQDELEDLVDRAEQDYDSLSYGFLPALLFLIPFVRRRRLKWFLRKWERAKQSRGVVPSIVAHSFGTYLVAEALRSYPQMQFDRIVFCGSIVEREFPWKEIYDRKQFREVLNQHGGVDIWADVVQYAVGDSGSSGKDGFIVESGAENILTQEKYSQWDHGDYFYRANYQRWLSFIAGEPLTDYLPVREARRNPRPLLIGLFVLAMVFGLYFGVCHKTQPPLSPTPTPAPMVTPLRSTASTIPRPTPTALASSSVPGSAPTKTPIHDSMAAPAKSIAVLLFENLSSDKENAYFAAGIGYEILTRLAKIGDLKVTSHSSSRQYQSKPANPRAVGQELGVATLLEGNVRKVGNRVRISVELIRAATDEHIWGEIYDRTLDDVFAVESEVASVIAAQLNAKLTDAEERAITERPTQSKAAYDAYRRGLSIESSRFSHSAYQEVAAAYADAVQQDPKFALAWARLAVTRAHLFADGVDKNNNSPLAVKEAADRAMDLQPESGETWVAQGTYRHRVQRNYLGALQAYDEARKRLPNSSLVFQQMAFVERRLGFWQGAEEHYKKAAELDPRDFRIFFSMGYEFFPLLRRFKEGQDALDRALQISPGDQNAIAAKASLLLSEDRLSEAAKQLARIPADSTDDFVALLRLWQAEYEGRFDAAIALIEPKVTALRPGQSLNFQSKVFLVQLGYCQQWVGRPADARVSFRRALKALKASAQTGDPSDSLALAYFLALAYAGLDEKTNALDQAHRAVAELGNDAVFKPLAEAILAQIQARFGDIDSAIAAIPHLLEVPAGLTLADLRHDPLWDPLRKDPRFAKLIGEPAK